MRVSNARETQVSHRDELVLSLWLVAVLLAEIVALVWFFGRLYTT
jgi:hypothetical protein